MENPRMNASTLPSVRTSLAAAGASIGLMLGVLSPAGATPFVLETVEAAGAVGLYSSLALDEQGNPQVSNYDDTNDDLK